MGNDKSVIAPPRLVDDVTAEWLSAALGERYPGVKVLDAKIDGLFGNKPNKTRIHLRYNDVGQAAGLPATMVLKATFPGLGPEGAGLDFATAVEVQAYEELVPTLSIETPKVYYSLLDWEGGNAVLLMEDLQQRGFKPLDAFTPLTFEQVSLFTDAMAKLHATHWESVEFNPGGRFGPETGIGQCRGRLHEKFLNMVVEAPWWNKFVDEPRAVALPRRLTEQARIARAWHKLVEVMAGSARTMVHGDEHSRNFYFTEDGRPGFLDYFARIENWPISFAYFLCNTIDSLDRRAWERPLLSRYLRRLSEAGVAAPSFDEAWYAYRCAVLFPMIVWFTNPAKWQPEATNTINITRAGLAMLDHQTLELLGV